MCRSLNLYMKYIYAEYFMVYLLRVRSSGWSLRIILQHGGGGARRTRPLAPPPPCWRLILRHASTTIWRGVRGGGKRGGGFDLAMQRRVSGSGWCSQVNSPSSFSECFFYPPLFFYHQRRPNVNPHMLQLISDEGNHLWTTLTWVLNSWLFFFAHPKLLIGTLST